MYIQTIEEEFIKSGLTMDDLLARQRKEMKTCRVPRVQEFLGLKHQAEQKTLRYLLK